MNLNQFQELSSRTVRKEDSFTQRLDNFAMGVGGEIAEVNELITEVAYGGLALTKIYDHLIKEVGDVLWYTSQMARLLEIPYADLFCKPAKFRPQAYAYVEATMRLSTAGGRMLDYVKKVVHHGHSLDRRVLAEHLIDVLSYLKWLVDHLGISLEEACRRNVAKLMERYPAGFESERSIHRVA